jgi:hypothetical protein
MDAKTYLKVSGINLAILLIGMALGVALTVFTTSVNAQVQSSAPPTKLGATPTAVLSQFEYVSPSISSGSAAFETLIAHRVASDQLMVNGYDLLKLVDSAFGVMIGNHLLTAEQAQQLANGSKVERPLRLQPPPK